MSIPPPSSERQEIGAFIRASRERAQPPRNDGFVHRRRHVHHMTQAELAERAGLSTVIISKVEQGQYPNVNPKLLQKISQALNLDQSQERYLLGLLQPAPTGVATGIDVPDWLLQSIEQHDYPVNVVNPRMDIVAWNGMVRHVLGDLNEVPPHMRNVVAMMFCVPELRQLFDNWEENVRALVSALKLNYAVVPGYRQPIADLVREVSAIEPLLGTFWEHVIPHFQPRIRKHMNHPVLGVLDFYEVISQVMGTELLTTVAFVPATDATLAVFARLGEQDRG